MHPRDQFVMVLAEDDPDDQLLAREALEETGLPHALITLNDGQELLDYLDEIGRFTQKRFPDLILLDLNLPRLDGRQALAELKRDEAKRRIPVVVLTTSRADEDVAGCYDLGVSGFVTKPVAFEDLVEVIRALDQYWFQMVTLPNKRKGG